MTTRNTLISTVGTSLFYPNLANLPDAAGYETWLAKQPAREREHLTCERVSALAMAYRERDPATIARALVALPPTTRLCGAEINSIRSRT